MFRPASGLLSVENCSGQDHIIMALPLSNLYTYNDLKFIPHRDTNEEGGQMAHRAKAKWKLGQRQGHIDLKCLKTMNR